MISAESSSQAGVQAQGDLIARIGSSCHWAYRMVPLRAGERRETLTFGPAIRDEDAALLRAAQLGGKRVAFEVQSPSDPSLRSHGLYPPPFRFSFGTGHSVCPPHTAEAAAREHMPVGVCGEDHPLKHAAGPPCQMPTRRMGMTPGRLALTSSRKQCRRRGPHWGTWSRHVQ